MDMATEKGWTTGRLPDQASMVLTEIEHALAEAIKETKNQQYDRLDF